MRAVTAVIFAVFAVSATVQETEIDNEKNSIATKPSIRLDPYIRKALLKALSDLESSEPSEIETGDGTTDELLRSGDDITEVTPTKSTEDVQYHSYVVDGQKAFTENMTDQPTFVQENVVFTSTLGNVENQAASASPTPDPFSELFQTKESKNLQQVRSIPNKINSKSNQVLESNRRSENKETEKIKITTTTLAPTPTTTTTPKPTHNNDGENIEEVSNKDVQVFQAPLVAAFTVHQDALGTPRKVEPIFKQQQLARQDATPAITTPLPGQTDFITQQLALQRELEQKQRLLEEQLRQLQLQQRQHEDLLRAQQIALQQKDSRRQQTLQQEELKKQQILQEQQRIFQQNLNQASAFQRQEIIQNNVRARIPQSPNSLVSIQPSESSVFRSQDIFQNNNVRTAGNIPQNQNSLVTVHPSVSFDASNTITNQQLPNREAVDFLLHLRNQQREQFPLQQNHLPHGISNLQLTKNNNFQTQDFRRTQSGGNFQHQQNFQQQLPDPRIRNFQHNIPHFAQQQQANRQSKQNGNFLQPSPGFQQQLPLQNDFVPAQNFKQGNRVFRQESGTGNFGVNNANRFNSFGPFHRFSRPNNFYSSDAELQHLLQQSGLSGRSQEDINIVSKVLALNHGVSPNNLISNLLSVPIDSVRRIARTL